MIIQKLFKSVTFPVFSIFLALFLIQAPLSTKAYEKKTEMIPMRDGIRLATDIYLLDGQTRKLPVVLVRTPYGREKWAEVIVSL